MAEAGLGVGGDPLFYSKGDLKLKRRVDFSNYFTMADVDTAVTQDFLDAGRGTTQMRSGWKMAPVGQVRGSSFLDAKMNYDDVVTAMEAGTVVFNSAGAHIPKLSAVSLAALDAFGYPTCLNLYLTAKGKKTSAPPHTDKQDVFVIQTQGFKHWRVYPMPNPAREPLSDPLARGKNNDVCDLDTLGEPLLDVILKPGDVLYVPAGCPHTTDTLVPESELPEGVAEQDSVHMTVGIDTYIWGLSYSFLRGLTYIRQGLEDKALGGIQGLYKGTINTLPSEIYTKLCAALPANFAHSDANAAEGCAQELQKWAAAAAISTKSEDDFSAVPKEEWEFTIRRAQEHCRDLASVFRQMYQDALVEGDRRRANPGADVPMDKLSVFRIKPYMERVEQMMDGFISYATNSPQNQASPNQNIPGPAAAAAANASVQWVSAEEQKPERGEEVRVDLGGALFEARVRTVRSDGAFDVEFFDGELEGGVAAARIKVKKSKMSAEDKAAKLKALRKKGRKRKR
uniref:Bifunctional lysine-specific demethylase and histidyl-hydroxylase n=3 Tax=Phaeomonas parva TaxID=124430 RepID=A0A7S1UAY8_9STRA|mmetsp:Transcript_39746/g.124126  ORF Transcript_39746/g.124126 Transcript_39746/m.124126 type:complete len:511 (+) Transcript_39746:184-1716(+)